MGLLNFFSGKPPEVIERCGDDYFNNGHYGPAKLEYEKGLYKAERKAPENEALIRRLREKIDKTKEALARFHKQTGENLMQSGSHADAQSLFALALELTRDDALKEEIRLKLKELDAGLRQDMKIRLDASHENRPKTGAPVVDDTPTESVSAGHKEAAEDAEEYFTVLCSTLPEEFQKAYQEYGQNFKEGYIALNRGEFDTAVKKLSASLAENPASFIPLELATALVNLGKNRRARELVEGFVQENSMVLRGYQILCDIYWEAQDYAAALGLFDSCPNELAQTLPVQLLAGETLYQAGRYDEARQIFSACEARVGENEIISRALARTYEAMGNIQKARSLYGKMISGCAACGARKDPFLKRRYAELSYEAGEKPAKLLELYLSLAGEDPDNRAEYYQRIAQIYESTGKDEEARRYRLMLEGLVQSTD
jgi:tetratricopeptide (TPR) repeat protein